MIHKCEFSEIKWLHIDLLPRSILIGEYERMRKACFGSGVTERNVLPGWQ